MSYSLSYTLALAVMVQLALKKSLRISEWLPVSRISATLGIPRPTVNQIVRRLAERGLVTTREGINGGVSLSRDPERVSLAEILDAIEGERPLFRVDVATGDLPEPGKKSREKTIEALAKAEEAMRSELRGVKLSDLVCS